MTTKEAVSHYETPANLATALGITVHAIYQWGSTPPKLRQFQIELLTGGKLKAQANG